MDAGGATRVALDHLAIDNDIARSRRPVAEPQCEANYAGTDGLGEMDATNHRLAFSVAKVPFALRVSRADDSDRVALQQTELMRIAGVNNDSVLRRERAQPIVADRAALGGADDTVGDQMEVVTLSKRSERLAMIVCERQIAGVACLMFASA